MKIRFNPLQRIQAGAMIAVLLLALLVAGTLASYLVLVDHENTSVARSQTWNSSLMMAEAGIEEGLAVINKYAGTATPLSSWKNTAVFDGWHRSSSALGEVYTKTNTVDSSFIVGSYTVYVTNLATGPVIVSKGSAKWNSSFGTYTAKDATRTVLLQTTDGGGSGGGSMVALTTIDFVGNNVTIDSFDSSNSNYCNWNPVWGYGTYDSSKRTAHAVVATDGNIINVQNANIYGYVDTAPGGTDSVGANGTVGDTNWVDGGNHGIQTGHSRDDMNTSFPPVSLPANLATPLVSIPGGTNIGGTTYNYVVPQTVGSGTNYYTVGSLGKNGSIYVNTSNVVISVTGGIDYKSGGTITVSTNSGVQNGLTLYVDGTIDTGSQGSINNMQQNAGKMSIYGTTNCTSIGLSGNGAGSSFIYAPSASLSMGGGGNNTYDLVGAIIVHDISLNGHFNFHYDEALNKNGSAGTQYIPTSWKEIFGG